MGRSRGNFHADEDPSQRSRRRRNASSGENLESTVAGQGTGEGKKALYHCNYCNKDITGKIRIKCAVCPDFDLCIECFSVGAEVTPHESNHPYRVMDNLSFPLICPDWNADEEILLLEGIEMYGMGNWAEIAEHVGTKSRQQCIQHYDSIYMNSPYFPLPDMTHVVGKNRKELLAMAKGHGEDKKGLSSLGELTLKEESLFSPSRITIEESHKNGPPGQLLSVNAGSTDLKRASNMPQIKNSPNSVKVEDHILDRNFGDQKPKPLKDEGPSLMELSGFNAKRQEFDPEYDNEAEQLLAEMDFKETDTEEERELKLRVLHIYSKRLDERKRRKDFILERNLLQPNPFEDLSLEEKDLCRRYDVFMRFHSKEEHDDLLKTVVQEHRIMKRIQELKEARAAGCRSSDEAIQYFEHKRKREAEESARGTKEETPPVVLSSQDGVNGFKSDEPVGRDSNSRTPGHVYSTSVAELLSESEKQLCCEMGLPMTDFLNMQEVMTIQIIKGYIAKKSDAYSFFSEIEPNKIDRIYDTLAKKGLTHA